MVLQSTAVIRTAEPLPFVWSRLLSAFQDCFDFCRATENTKWSNQLIFTPSESRSELGEMLACEWPGNSIPTEILPLIDCSQLLKRFIWILLTIKRNRFSASTRWKIQIQNIYGYHLIAAHDNHVSAIAFYFESKIEAGQFSINTVNNVMEFDWAALLHS